MKRKPIRVTSVLSFVESAWKEYWFRKVGFEEADRVSEESSSFGTRVHKLIEGALKGEIKIEVSSVVPEEQCAVDIIMWLEQNNVKPLFETYDKSLEIEVSDKTLNLTGHFDYATLVNGVPTIIDFKTSNKMRKSFPLQKAAYAKMASKQLGIKIDDGITLRAHWDKEAQAVEFEVKHYDNLTKKYWPVFKSCLDVWKYFNYAEDKNENK